MVPSSHTLVGSVNVVYDLAEGRSLALMEAAVPKVGQAATRTRICMRLLPSFYAAV
jgi:hypothetical protein